jgi:Nucleotidyltransferase domain
LSPPTLTAESYAASALARWDLTLDDVRSFVAPVTREQTLLLVGSVASGLATVTSDIDLLLIASDTDIHEGITIREADFESSVFRHPSGYRVNVDLWTPSQLTGLERRFTSALACVVQPDVLHDLHVVRSDEVALLHQLATGVVLENPDLARAWRDRLRVHGLPAYVQLMGCWYCFAHIFNAEGELAEGNLASAMWMTRSCVDQLAVALLAAQGETCPSQRWRVRLLERHRQRLGDAVVDALIDGMFISPGQHLAVDVERVLQFARAQLQQLFEGKAQLGELISALATGDAQGTMR